MTRNIDPLTPSFKYAPIATLKPSEDEDICWVLLSRHDSFLIS